MIIRDQFRVLKVDLAKERGEVVTLEGRDKMAGGSGLKDVHYMQGLDLQVTGKMLHRMFSGSGHRSILRIGPAGEKGSAMEGISGETLAREALMRNTACSGCPIGCIHVGFVREKFMEPNQYLYRQVSYDQKHQDKDAEKAVGFLVQDEQECLLLTSMVPCLFAREVYKRDVLAECLDSLGHKSLAGALEAVSAHVQKERWKMRIPTGFKPSAMEIPRRFSEVTTWKGKVDEGYMEALQRSYRESILEVGGRGRPK